MSYYRLCFLVSLLLALGSRTVRSQEPLRVVEVRIVGVLNADSIALSRSLAPLFREAFTTVSSLTLRVQEGRATLLKALRDQGFYRARVESTGVEGEGAVRSVRFAVFEGKRERFTQIRVSSEDKQLEQSLNEYLASLPAVSSEASVDSTIADIVMWLGQHDRQFAKVRFKEILPVSTNDRNALEVLLVVDPGMVPRLERVTILGNSTTEEKVILRELRLKMGAPYDSRSIGRARSRLERLRFFEQVAEPELLLLTDSTFQLVIRVVEGRTTFLDGVIGYQPAATAEAAGAFTGFLTGSFQNISGTGRNGSLDFRREGGGSQQLEVRYLEPWIFEYPISLDIGFLQREMDSTYVRTKYLSNLALLFTEDASVSGLFEYDKVIPTDFPGRPFSVFASTTLTTGLRALFDSRDNVVAPIGGAFTTASIQYGSKRIEGPARFLDSSGIRTVGLRTLTLDAAGYVEILPRNVLTATLHASDRQSLDGQLEESDLFLLGGFKSIRGYRESSFLVSRYVYADLEYRFMLGKFSYLGLFMTGGYLFREGSATTSEQVRKPVSYGLGTQVETPLGYLSVQLALPHGEPLEQAKLHFGILAQF